MVILIHGKKRSGKDTSAEIIQKLVPEAIIKPFAGPLKEITAKSFNLTLDTIDYLKNDESIKIGFKSPNEKMCTDISMRNFLQNLGTEAIKPIFGEDVWAKLFADYYSTLPPKSILIAPDFRVQEEYDYLQSVLDFKEVVTGKIVRQEVEDSGDTHVTEQGLADFKFDYTIHNDGTLADLRVELVDLLDKILL